jgi:hypothetical protein
VTNAHATIPTVSIDHIGLHVIEYSGVKALQNNLGVYDFDLVNRLETPLIRQTFRLRNESNFPLSRLSLHLSRLRGLQVLLADPTAKSAPYEIHDQQPLPTLKPGQEIRLFITLDLATLPPGKVTQTLDVLAADHDRPVLRLMLTGQLLPVVTFSPDTLDFGKVPARQTKSLTLNLSIDPRLAPFGSVPKLYCTNPNVQIEPIPLDASAKRTSPLLNPKQKAAGLYSYLVTLSDEASVGVVSGNLQVAYITPPKESEEKPASAFKPLDPVETANALHSVAATLTGIVVGDISASPPAVLFGTVEQGKEAVQRIVLTPKSAITLQNVQINSPVRWLSARWAETTPLPVSTANRVPTRSLDLILSPQAPVGKLQTELVLTLANGQRLVLPVSAFVRQAAVKP